MELHACEQTLSIGCKAAYTATMINVSSMLSMRIKSTCAHAVLQYHGLHFPLVALRAQSVRMQRMCKDGFHILMQTGKGLYGL